MKNHLRLFGTLLLMLATMATAFAQSSAPAATSSDISRLPPEVFLARPKYRDMQLSPDDRVPLIHGTRMRAALDKYNKPYERVVYDDEWHGFNKDENRYDFYRRVDAFLAKNLAPRSPASAAAAAASTASAGSAPAVSAASSPR